MNIGEYIDVCLQRDRNEKERKRERAREIERERERERGRKITEKICVTERTTETVKYIVATHTKKKLCKVWLCSSLFYSLLAEFIKM